jgi:hypothetical protein
MDSAAIAMNPDESMAITWPVYYLATGHVLTAGFENLWQRIDAVAGSGRKICHQSGESACSAALAAASVLWGKGSRITRQHG